MSFDELYSEIFMEIYDHPHNFGTIESADLKSEDSNPLCGDKINIYIKIDENRRITDVKLTGKGCAISMVSASMLTDKIKGMRIEEVLAIKPEEVIELLKVPVGSTRVKCALLPLAVIRKATGINP